MHVHIVMHLYLSAHSQWLCGIVEAVRCAALSGSTSSSSVSLPEVEACHISARLLFNTLLLHTQFSFSATVIEVNYHILLFLWVLRLSSHLPAWTAKPLTHWTNFFLPLRPYFYPIHMYMCVYIYSQIYNVLVHIYKVHRFCFSLMYFIPAAVHLPSHPSSLPVSSSPLPQIHLPLSSLGNKKQTSQGHPSIDGSRCRVLRGNIGLREFCGEGRGKIRGNQWD